MATMLPWLPRYYGNHMLPWLPYVAMATIYVKLFGVLFIHKCKTFFIQVDFVQKVQELSLKVNLTTRLSTLAQCL